MFVLILCAWAGELEDARAAAQRYPGDYGSQLRLAQVATDPKEALEAWKQAWSLSGGNLEVYPGLVQAALVAGDVGLAREVAEEAVAKEPESAVAWRLQALALATPKGLEAADWATVHSQNAVRAALIREPEGLWSDCLRAWNRLRLGDLPGVRQVGAQGNCAPDLDDKATLSAGLFLSGTMANGQSLGGSGALWAGATVKQGLSLELLGRYSAFQVVGGGGGGGGAVYGRVGYGRGLVGGSVFGGGSLGTSGGSVEPPAGTDEPAFVSTASQTGTVGVQLWAKYGLSLHLEGLLSRGSNTERAEVPEDLPAGAPAPPADFTYAERSWQLSAGVGVPILRGLHLELDGQLSDFYQENNSGNLLSYVSIPTEYGPLGLGSAALHYQRTGLDLVVGGRFGKEVNPFRVQSLLYYDLDRPFGSSFFAEGSVRLAPPLWLNLGYDYLSLPETAAEESSNLHMATLGLVFTPGAF